MADSQSTPPDPNDPPARPADPVAGAPAGKGTDRGGAARSLLGGAMRYLQDMTRDVVSVALGRTSADPGETAEAGEGDTTSSRPLERTDAGAARLNLLHGVAEKVRGAADTYIAAKLDEIEARVDTKLDHIEQRIDEKIIELHDQLREMRDRELRHRLRLLKLTLIFTVLVALLSLVYKWASDMWTS